MAAPYQTAIGVLGCILFGGCIYFLSRFFFQVFTQPTNLSVIGKKLFLWRKHKMEWPRVYAKPLSAWGEIFASVRVPQLFTPYRVFFGWICLSLILVFGLGVFGFAIVIFFSAGGVFYFVKKSRGQRSVIVRALPHFFERLADALRAGYHPPQALAFIEPELSAPFKQVIAGILRLYSRGMPFSLALHKIEQMVRVREWTVGSELIGLADSIGGVPAGQFSVFAKNLRDEQDAVSELEALTAAGRTSGFVLAVLHPFVLFFFWLLAPQYIAVLFGTMLGKILFMFSLLLEIVGFWWISKIIRL